MRTIYNKIFLVLLTGLLFAACEENAIPELAEPLPDSATEAKFFFHVEEAPEANFYVAGQKATSAASTDETLKGFNYGSIFPSNAYAVVESGDVDIVAETLEGEALATTSANFEEDSNYSVYLVGTTNAYEIFVMEDELPEVDTERIYWRFVNTMAEMPFSVDAYAVRGGEDPAVISLGNNLDFKQAGDYVALDPGNYTFKVFESGSEYDPETSEPYIQHSLNLSSMGRIYSTQIRGTYSETPASSNIDYWREY
ncbi:DUF4397 domain-containing protein [Salegentibacter sediminis]|uniref:DUF4397 domain-containing protein n=1 Tax=Salegentibacter sediminis TaxID=1930251 RepID=UPI0009C1685D|nr:DUF4397 domain-containing protein [Salegentibacter sediminis]